MTSIPKRHTVIVLGGHLPHQSVLDHLPERSSVICADSGLDHAISLDLHPDVVIGDFDSVTAAALERARIHGAVVVPHPADKDHTDAELALTYALDHGATAITIVWGGGDRFDHVLGVMAAVAHPRLAALDALDIWIERDQLHVVHASSMVTIDHPPDTVVSLLPLGGGEVRLSTTGLIWDLRDDVLDGYSARGVSNVIEQSPVRIDVETGVLAIVVPDAAAATTGSIRRSRSAP